MAHNAGDEKKVKAKESKIKLERDQELADIKDILETDAGIRFFKRFLRESKMFTTTFTGNSQTFFLEGQRALALRFFADICDAAPARIIDVITEKIEEDKTDDLL